MAAIGQQAQARSISSLPPSIRRLVELGLLSEEEAFEQFPEGSTASATTQVEGDTISTPSESSEESPALSRLRSLGLIGEDEFRDSAESSIATAQQETPTEDKGQQRGIVGNVINFGKSLKTLADTAPVSPTQIAGGVEDFGKGAGNLFFGGVEKGIGGSIVTADTLSTIRGLEITKEIAEGRTPREFQDDPNSLVPRITEKDIEIAKQQLDTPIFEGNTPRQILEDDELLNRFILSQRGEVTDVAQNILDRGIAREKEVGRVFEQPKEGASFLESAPFLAESGLRSAAEFGFPALVSAANPLLGTAAIFGTSLGLRQGEGQLQEDPNLARTSRRAARLAPIDTALEFAGIRPILNAVKATRGLRNVPEKEILDALLASTPRTTLNAITAEVPTEILQNVAEQLNDIFIDKTQEGFSPRQALEDGFAAIFGGGVPGTVVGAATSRTRRRQAENLVQARIQAQQDVVKILGFPDPDVQAGIDFDTAAIAEANDLLANRQESTTNLRGESLPIDAGRLGTQANQILEERQRRRAEQGGIPEAPSSPFPRTGVEQQLQDDIAQSQGDIGTTATQTNTTATPGIPPQQQGTPLQGTPTVSVPPGAAQNTQATNTQTPGTAGKATAAPTLTDLRNKAQEIESGGLFSVGAAPTVVTAREATTTRPEGDATREFVKGLLSTPEGRKTASLILQDKVLVAESSGVIRAQDVRGGVKPLGGRQEGDTFLARGVFTGNNIILFRDNVTPGEAASVVAHEVDHFFNAAADNGAATPRGLRGLVGKEANDRAIESIRKLASEGSQVAQNILDIADNNSKLTGTPVVDEIVPIAIEEITKERAKGTALGRLGSIPSNIVASAKNTLRGFGIDLGFTEADLSNLSDRLTSEFSKIDNRNMLDGSIPQASSGKKALFTLVGESFNGFESFRQQKLTFTGPDGKARAELDTKGAKTFPGIVEDANRRGLGVDTSVMSLGDRLTFQNAARGNLGKATILGDVLNFPTLFSGYQEFRNTPVIFTKLGKNRDGKSRVGAFSPSKGAIFIDPTQVNDSNLVDAVLHEVQHLTQHREGFTPGASINRFLSPKDVARITSINEELQTAITGFIQQQNNAGEEAVRQLKDTLIERFGILPEFDRISGDSIKQLSNIISHSNTAGETQAQASASLVNNSLEQTPLGKELVRLAKLESERNGLFNTAYEQYLAVLGEAEFNQVTERAKRRREGEDIPLARSTEEFFEGSGVNVQDLTDAQGNRLTEQGRQQQTTEQQEERQPPSRVKQDENQTADSSTRETPKTSRTQEGPQGLGRTQNSNTRFSATSAQASQTAEGTASAVQGGRVVPDLRHPDNGNFFKGFLQVPPGVGKGPLSRKLTDVVRLFLPNKGLPTRIVEAAEQLQGEAAAAQLDALTKINAFNEVVSQEAEQLGVSSETILNEIQKIEEAVASKQGNARREVRRIEFERFKNKFPESAKGLTALRRTIFKNSLAIGEGMLNSGRILTQEELKIVTSIHENLGEFLTRSFKLFQGSKSRTAQLKFLRKTPEGRKIVKNTESFILEHDILIPPFDKLTSLPKEKLISLYDIWVDNKGNNPANLSREQLIGDIDASRGNQTDGIAQKEAKRVVEELLKARTSTLQIAGKIASFYKKGQVDQTIATARTGVPKEIRALFGEIQQPVANIFQTLVRQGNFIAKTETLSSIGKELRGEFLFEKQADLPPGVVAQQLTGAEWGPLQNLWTSQDIKEVLSTVKTLQVTFNDVYEGLMSGRQEGILPTVQATMNTAAWLGRGLKFANVVLDPAAIMYNFMGSPIQMIANGNFLFENAGQSMKEVFLDLNGAAFKNIAPEQILELVRLKLVDNSITGEIALAEMDQILELTGVGAKLGGWTEVKSRWTDFFSAADLYAKIANFKREERVLTEIFEKAGETKSAEEIKQIAAARIRRTNFTFDRAFRVTKTLEKAGVTNYFTYMGEALRTVAGNYMVGIQDIAASNKIKNPETRAALRNHGIRRTIGAVMASLGHTTVLGLYASGLQVAFGLIGRGISAITGFGEDDDEDKFDIIQKGLALSEQTKFLVPFSKEGTTTKFFDASRVDPFGPGNDILRAIFENDTEKLADTVQGLFIWNMGVERLVEAVSGITSERTRPANTSFGFRYPDAEALLVEVAQERFGIEPATATRLIKGAESIVPAFAKSIIGTLIAKDRTPEQAFESLGDPETLLRAFGMRTIDFSPEEDVPKVLRFEYLDRISDSRSRLIEGIRGASDPSEETITSLVVSGIRNEFEGYTKARDVIAAAKASGVPSRTLFNLVKRVAGANERQIEVLASGQFDQTFISVDSLRNAMRTDLLKAAAENIDDPDKAKLEQTKIRTKYGIAISRIRSALSTDIGINFDDTDS